MGHVFISDQTWADFKSEWQNGTAPWKAGGDEIVSDADAHISDIDTNGMKSVTDDVDTPGNHAEWDPAVTTADYSAMQYAAGAIRTLAMAYALTDTQNYADYAIDYIYHWCLQGYKDGATPATYMIPHADTDGDHANRLTNTFMIRLYLSNSAIPYGGSFLLGNGRWTSAKGGSTPNAEAHFVDWCDDMLRGTYGLRNRDYRDVGAGEMNNIYMHYLSNIAAYAGFLYDSGHISATEFTNQVEYALTDWQNGYDDNFAGGDMFIKETGETDSDVCRGNGLHYTCFGQMAATMLCLVRRAYDSEVTFAEEGYQWDDATHWSGTPQQPAMHRAGSFLAPYLQDTDLVNATLWEGDSATSTFLSCTGNSYTANQAPYSNDEMVEKGSVMVILDSVFNQSEGYTGYKTAYENIESITTQQAETWAWRFPSGLSRFSFGHLAPYVRQYDLTATGGGGGGSSSLKDYITSNTTGVVEHWSLLGADNDANGFPQGSLNGATYELDGVAANVAFNATGAEGNTDAMDLGVSPSYVRRDFTVDTDLGAQISGDIGFCAIVKLPVGYLPNDASGDTGDIVNFMDTGAGVYADGGFKLTVRDDGSIRLVVATGSADRSYYTSTEVITEDAFWYITGHYRASDGAVRVMAGEIGVDADLATLTMTEGSGSVFTGDPSGGVDRFEIGEASFDNSDSLEGICHGGTLDNAYLSATEMQSRYDAIGGTGGLDLVEVVDEILHINETIVSSRVLNRSVDESLHIFEDTVSARDLVRLEDEVLHINEDTLGSLALNRIVGESLHILETENKTLSLNQVIDELLHLNETTVRSRSLVRMQDEALHILEEDITSRTLNRIIDENLHLFEEPTLSKAMNRVVDEALHIIETTSVLVGGTLIDAVVVESIRLVTAIRAKVGLSSSIQVEDIEVE